MMMQFQTPAVKVRRQRTENQEIVLTTLVGLHIVPLFLNRNTQRVSPVHGSTNVKKGLSEKR